MIHDKGLQHDSILIKYIVGSLNLDEDWSNEIVQLKRDINIP